jgi:hypothetical protein
MELVLRLPRLLFGLLPLALYLTVIIERVWSS